MASSFSPSQSAATLSAIAYLGQYEFNSWRFATMNKAMAGTLGGSWSIVWGPATAGQDLAYVAYDGDSTYAVVVRGTLVTRVEDLLQDKTIGTQVALPFSAPSFPNAQISQGAAEVWTNINSMDSSVPGSGAGGLLAFLQGLSGSPTVLVTGHSLGGQTASVLAAWFASTLSGATVVPITVAAPTAGNAAFASAYDSVFASSAQRLFNTLDVVPMLWTVAGLDTLLTLYSGGPQCGPTCSAAVNSALNTLQKGGVTYVQPSASTSLTGSLYSESGILAFEDEVLAQHSALYYMSLLGIPTSTIQVLNKDWAPPSTAAVRSVA
ncbi:hypothetical protein KRR26_17605 [Corallococcus sp. M34]|uniref:lipase family protein n=1 Tax=Citreicoccus inhibens TaxID=2849499 RepID=UPI001C23585E|nr:hypothetical protein [Citreicoccus inhibens]MBU8897437.1 hypothetical protein [Citreicoccus inhibens]